MANELPPDINELENRLQAESESLSLREQILWRYFEEESLHCHKRRIDHILWIVHSYPRNSICRSPVIQVNPKICLEGYRRIQNEWLNLVDENPGDVGVARGAASFFCMKNINSAKKILNRIIDNDPNQAEAWLDLGRLTSDAKDRVRYFKKARQLGAKQPNLLVWISRSAIEACDLETAETIGWELLKLADDARAKYGDKLDWKEKSNAIWEKALAVMGDRPSATKLVRAISSHAYHKHWGHTALGHVAIERNDLNAALNHLSESGDVVNDPRLSSYGPSFTLAKELCVREQWTHVAAYLKACESIWEDERLPIWRSMVESNRVPDF